LAGREKNSGDDRCKEDSLSFHKMPSSKRDSRTRQKYHYIATAVAARIVGNPQTTFDCGALFALRATVW
jgi:hypothetical protein